MADEIRRPEGEGEEIETAIEHIRAAEHDLARAHADESRAEHELEAAVDELDCAERDKDFWLIVNGRRKEVHKRRLTFAQVVALAFPDAPPSENIIYTVTYRNGGNERHPDGTLVAGESVKIKDGTIFDVTATDKS
jgi:Multiubiquitin